MRRSSGPLRVPNENEPQRSRSHSRTSVDSRLSSGSVRQSSGSRSSFGATGIPRPRPSTSNAGPAVKRRMTNRFGSESKQDPRPITERHFKDKCIRELIEFLVDNKYPHPCPPKMLQTPPSKDFIRIFEFMYGILEPQFKVTKIEEQFPYIMKELGYSATLSKSAMYAIGSPHTWPHLLAALTWLRELIQYYNTMDVESIMFPASSGEEFEAASMSKLYFDYCKSTYASFLEGADTYEEQDAILAKEISKNSAGGDIESLIQENRRLQQELEFLEKQPDRLNECKNKLANLKLDHDKLLSYGRQLESHTDQQRIKIKSLDEELKQHQLEFSAVKQEVRKKQEILATQVFSQDDVERINQEQLQLKQSIDSVESANESIQNLVWELERKIGKGQETLIKKVNECNQKARELGLIPCTAENAHGIDFEMHHALEEVHSNHYNNTIRPALNQMKNEQIDKLNLLETEHIQVQTVLDQLSDLAQEKKDIVSTMEKKLTDINETLERQKKSDQEELAICQREVDDLEQKIKEMRSGNRPDLQRLMRDLQAEKTNLEQKKLAREKKLNQFVEFLQNAARMIVDHKHKIQEHTKKLKEESTKQLEEEQKNIGKK